MRSKIISSTNFRIILLDTVLIFTYIKLLGINNVTIASEEDKLILLICGSVIFSSLFQNYNFQLKHFSLSDLIRTNSIIALAVVIIWFTMKTISFTEASNIFLTISFLTVVYKIAYRYIYELLKKKSLRKKVIIFGAGDRGIALKKGLQMSSQFEVVAFIDDNKKLWGKRLDNTKIYPLGEEIEKLIQQLGVKHIVFSTTKVSKKRKVEALEFFENQNLEVFNINLADGWAVKPLTVSKLKKIKIEDLLERQEIYTDFSENKKFYTNKVILITGAAGSIGSQLLEEILKFSPKHVIAIDKNETEIFKLSNKYTKNRNCQLLLLDILDEKSLEKIFSSTPINIIFHAAAYKHVSIVEANPVFGVRNNLIGTYNLTKLAINHNVERFVLISTDKAVNPTNVMGASKRACELSLGLPEFKNSKTKFITTRFGNVLGSNGSVIPIFREQINQGGPVTVTHKDINRFFMTIPEASRLVIEAGRIGQNNNIYLFDMGKPIKIMDLAKNMITLSGYEFPNEIDIKITGLRPGEKLYEELLLKTEKLQKSSNNHIYIGEKDVLTDDQVTGLRLLVKSLNTHNIVDEISLVTALKRIIPEYKSNNSRFETLD